MSAKQTTTTRRKTKKHVRCPNCGKFMGNVSSNDSKEFTSYSETSSKSSYTNGNKTVTQTTKETRKKSKKKKRVK